MELINRSGAPTEMFTALDKAGREHLVVVTKVTYRVGEGRLPDRAEVHEPIVTTDVFVGEPGLSAPVYESDHAFRKQRCDVLADATAHAPGGRAVTELPVAVRVGAMTKQLRVVGDRVFRRGAFRVSATSPKPFTSMPIHYGRGFGGSHLPKPGTKAAEGHTYLANPVGVGYAADPSSDVVEGMLLPNTEDYKAPVTSPDGRYRPLAFGPIGRHWDPRRAYAGTCDATWREEVFPFLPDDFDEAFFQAAPPDQQIAFPKGGEEVALQNLTPDRPLVTFELPQAEMVMKVLHASQRVTELQPVVDTLFFRPEAGLFTMVYRASVPLDRQSIFGVKIVATGPVCKKWWASKVLGTSDCGCGGDSNNDPDAEGAEDAKGAEGAGESEPS